MYKLLPLVSVYASVLPTIPVELWCLILRMLDGDPVLKKNVKDAAKKERQEIMNQLMKPGMSATVTREERARLFGSNIRKKVKISKCPSIIEAARVGIVATRRGLKAEKMTKPSRYAPYRI
ncbi:uncharacterized protein [Euwallacea fornicatus]|uniref:uncharacterized protein n=1 Tax=Euwallacea fornicatus TaxID=995702 RepID=UPI00338EB897